MCAVKSSVTDTTIFRTYNNMLMYLNIIKYKFWLKAIQRQKTLSAAAYFTADTALQSSKCRAHDVLLTTCFIHFILNLVGLHVLTIKIRLTNLTITQIKLQINKQTTELHTHLRLGLQHYYL